MEIHRRDGMWCLICFLKTKIVKHIYGNNFSVVKPNEQEKEYDHVYYITIQVVDGIFY